MSCFGQNYNPEPPREWSRYENPCVYANNPIIVHNGVAYKLDVLKKGNILQYKKNSSNLTKQQRYAQIARGMWTNRTTTWATQSQSYTNPNTNSLKRIGYTTTIKNNFIPLNQLSSTIAYQQTSLPITCPPTNVENVFETLPTNNGNNKKANSTPTVPPQEYPEPIAPLNPTIPPLVEVEPPETVVIPDGGTLICNISENPCTGEIYSSTENSFCNPTTASDVPGTITSLCYNDGLPTYYPRQRRTYSTGGNKWPQGEKFIKSAVEPFIQQPSFNTSSILNVASTNNTSSSSGTLISRSRYNALVTQYNNLEKMITDATNKISESELNIAKQLSDATDAIIANEVIIKNHISNTSQSIISKEESNKQEIQDYTSSLVDTILTNERALKTEIIENTNNGFADFSSKFSNKLKGVFSNFVTTSSIANNETTSLQIDNQTMSPLVDDTIIEDAANVFKSYFEDKFSKNATQIDSIKSDLSSVKNTVIANEDNIKHQLELYATKDDLKQELAANTSAAFSSLAQNINMVFSSASQEVTSQINTEITSLQQLDDLVMVPLSNEKIDEKIDEQILPQQSEDPVMSPKLDDSLLINATQTFKNYFDGKFTLNANQFNSLQSSILQTETNIKSYVSDKIENNVVITNNKITELSNTISNENVYINQQLTYNKELITSKIAESESSIKLYINETNEDRENEYKTYINQQLEITKSSIGGKIDTTKSDITGLITTAKSDLTGLITTAKSDITGLINTTKAEILANNAVISGKMDVIKSDITGLINTTKAQLETIIQSVVTSNNQIFVLLSAVAANGGGGGNGNGSGSGTIQETMIHTLLISETVSTIMNYYSDLASGNFEALSTELTGEKFAQLSKELFDFKSGLAINSDYETIRRIIVTSFEALMRMVTTNIAYLELQNNYEVIFNRAKILDNIELLKEYVDSLNNSSNLNIVPNITIEAPIIELRPEIQAYIDKYGIPKDGIFIPDKLAEFITN